MLLTLVKSIYAKNLEHFNSLYLPHLHFEPFGTHIVFRYISRQKSIFVASLELFARRGGAFYFDAVGK